MPFWANVDDASLGASGMLSYRSTPEPLVYVAKGSSVEMETIQTHNCGMCIGTQNDGKVLLL
jgi:hypothetical protein